MHNCSVGNIPLRTLGHIKRENLRHVCDNIANKSQSWASDSLTFTVTWQFILVGPPGFKIGHKQYEWHRIAQGHTRLAIP